MSQNTKKKKGLFSTLGRWCRRMFLGSAKDIDVLAVEEIVSPGRAIVKNFFSRKLAVVALVILVLMFLLVFIGPIFMPIDLEYSAPSQANTAPTLSMMKVPSAMKGQVKSISSYSTFSVGLSEEGKVYVWGNGQMGTSTANLKDIPDEVRNNTIAFAAAGKDHAIAIAEDGKIYGWGVSENGQYGDKSSLSDTYMGPVLLKDVLPEEKVADVNQVESLVCGNQVSAIVMKDGTVYLWGNCRNGASNYKTLSKLDNIQKMVFTNSSAAVLLKDGTVVCNGSGASAYEKIDMGDGRILTLEEVIAGRKVVDIAATNKTIALLLEDGALVIAGNSVSGESQVPDIGDEKMVAIAGGALHYSVVTDKGGVYTWGNGAKGSGAFQSGAPKNLTTASAVFTGPYQNYAVDENGKLLDTWGVKGYVFGTDNAGRDILARVVNGGQMTMTIGAVAVIVSSIIGIIIGCLSGYFGGWVDMILMRITEIFSSIPFLPFALILSAVLSTRSVPETTRIFMIMVILGLLSWTGLARLVRAQVLAEREKEFVLAAKAMGVRERKIAFKHILPNIISVIIVTMTLDFASCMLTESSLSYLGFGVQLPRPTWGNMLDGCNSSIVIQNFWWRWLFPALFLGIATICINVLGDTLRDVMDPKSSSER